MRGSRVKFAENRLILGQIYSTLPPFLSIQTDNKSIHISLLNFLAKLVQKTVFLLVQLSTFFHAYTSASILYHCNNEI